MSSNQTESVNNPLEAEVIAYLDQRRGKVYSYTGGWFPGKAVYSHGYSMLEELVGKKSYFQIQILNATGKLVDPAFAKWLEAIYGCLSWPDPRIWCNQIGALAGAARASGLAATVMGCLATDSRAYGIRPIKEGVGFIQQALRDHHAGATAADIVAKAVADSGGKPYIVGYKRPIARGDERLEVMEKISRELGIAVGPHLQLAYEIEQVLLETYNEGMNINGYASAVFADQGFTPEQVYHLGPTAVASGVTACYLDTLRRPPDSFMPLRCSDMDYRGPAPRPVPER